MRSGPSAPPSLTGMTWSAVRSLVAPQVSQRGLAAIVARARARFGLVEMHYAHLGRDAEQSARAKLDAHAAAV